MTVAFPGNTPVLINGNPIQVGDWIGAFYLNENNEFECGGSVSWSGEGTNIAIWGSDSEIESGFSEGQEIYWFVYDNENNNLIEAEMEMSCLDSGEPNIYICNIDRWIDR